MPKQKNEEKGITMITLAVTIIVLIILAGVSLNATVGENGIITQAQKARENIEIAKVKEEEQLNNLYEELINGGEGIFDDSMADAIEKLKNFRKIIATAITNEGVQTAETATAEIMAENIGKIIEEKTKNATATAEDITEGKTAWVKGELIVGTRKEGSTENSDILKLKEGDYVKYNSGTNGEILCRVLYPASSGYGVQIISDKNVKSVTLGGTTKKKKKNSYNNAIETLNNEAEVYINTNYATDARCVGSIPTVENGVFADKNSEMEGPFTMQFEYNGSRSIDCKQADTNYTIDQAQMIDLGIWDTKEKYWLASRIILELPGSCHFRINGVNTDTGWSGALCTVDSQFRCRRRKIRIWFSSMYSSKE